MYALSAAIHQNRSRAWTYCGYRSFLGTHALAIRMAQRNSRSIGLSGYAWHSLTPSRPDIVKQLPGPSLHKLMAQFRFAFWISYWCMLSATIHQNRSRAWTYCCYVASSLGTHALVIRRSQKNSRSAGLRGYAWHSLTLSRPDIVKQLPGPSLRKLMAQSNTEQTG